MLDITLHDTRHISATCGTGPSRAWVDLEFIDGSRRKVDITIFFHSAEFAQAFAAAVNQCNRRRFTDYVPEPPPTCVGCGQIESQCECYQFDSERK